MNIFRKYSLKKQLRSLQKNSEYAFAKMREHEQDENSSEWKNWAVLNTVYLGEMLKIKAQLKGIEV